MIAGIKQHATPFGKAALCIIVGLVLLPCGSTVQAQDDSSLSLVGGDVMSGWRVFHEKRCADCHSIWDQGGRVGPDLGRARTGRVSDARLAGIMWNHIPKMLGQMRQTGIPPTRLTKENMADMFALIFFVRQLDELGDPRRGEEILRSKGCSECHSTDSSNNGVGPDLSKWSEYANPVVWAQMMWEHAPVMEEAMRRSDMTWPKLEGTDLVHIVAYVRSSGGSGEKTYLRPGSVTRGRQLFTEKECSACHPGTGPDLAKADLPTSIGALASRMWNHSPEMARQMREKHVERRPMSPQELSDILAFVLALGNQDRGGDPAKGERVFNKKGCTECHDQQEVAGAVGPTVKTLSADSSPVHLAAAMWNHGETMLQQMTEAGLSWPVFNDREMVDLLAYFAALAKDDDGTK